MDMLNLEWQGYAYFLNYELFNTNTNVFIQIFFNIWFFKEFLIHFKYIQDENLLKPLKWQWNVVIR